jgi:ATP phosphoribosyltransferase regulatory subunit
VVFEMTSNAAWVLPDHIADVLPSEARQIEHLRRRLLDTSAGYGYELVMPPLLEYADSLLTGTGQALDLQTFKLIDLLSGRTLGLRADSTPQVARIDAHLLNRSGVARLSYCGAVLHSRQGKPHATREPLQFGAELYGHAGIEADLEIQDLALTSLRQAGLARLSVDLSDARIASALLFEVQDAQALQRIHAALASKDSAELRTELHLAKVSAAPAQALLGLLQAYGDEHMLRDVAHRLAALTDLPASQTVLQAFDDLRQAAQGLKNQTNDVNISFDLADLRGYAYYTGLRFSIYAPGAVDAIARGGRYDDIGAVFGRKRPAVGFSFDLKEIVALLPALRPRAAIRAPWLQDAELTLSIAHWRAQGETVVCSLPGHEHEVDEFNCDRQLARVAGRWVVQALAA